jgi:hypothetical protein
MCSILEKSRRKKASRLIPTRVMGVGGVWEGDQELKEHRGCCICGVVLSTVERYLARYVAGNKAFKVCKEYLFTSSTASSSCLSYGEENR